MVPRVNLPGTARQTVLVEIRPTDLPACRAQNIRQRAHARARNPNQVRARDRVDAERSGETRSYIIVVGHGGIPRRLVEQSGRGSYVASPARVNRSAASTWPQDQRSPAGRSWPDQTPARWPVCSSEPMERATRSVA